MSETHYDAHPSLFRMRPFATLFTMLLVVGGIAVALVGDRYLPPVFAQHLDGKSLQIGGIVVFAFSMLQLLSWWVSTLSDRLAITDDELIWTHGLLSKQYTEINMGSIRSVRVTQSLLQRILDAGDVTVYTAGDDPDLLVRGMPEPSRIRELIKAQND